MPPTELCARCEWNLDMSLTLEAVVQPGGSLGCSLGQRLLAIVAVGVVVAVGRVVLSVAWRPVTGTAVVVGLLIPASLFS